MVAVQFPCSKSGSNVLSGSKSCSWLIAATKVNRRLRMFNFLTLPSIVLPILTRRLHTIDASRFQRSMISLPETI
ncbi:uncharacterized protein EAF01_002627 [Botrytis porri]|uniref:uncharacterized protein n=1 Tax=Botrytis porri TaxID=87229 RepID=UPI001900B5FE|nr:uncharacterized protein EAF01_002627 [Botrytis porri]KAF7911119.1 hypothetical protein EAF01_002627 [Botrytis porri]